jgi:hypothetical protein
MIAASQGLPSARCASRSYPRASAECHLGFPILPPMKWKATYKVEHGVLHGHFLEYHLVFSKGACLICQQVLNPPQFFGDRRIPRDCPRYLGVSIDTVGIVDLGHVQVDSEGDGDDVGEQEDETEELDDPLALEVVQSHHEEAEKDHAKEQEFRELIELKVELPDLS